MVAACALVAAAAGQPQEAEAAAERVLALPSATYLDRSSALIVLGLVRDGESAREALDAAAGELLVTEDVVSAAMLGLASLVRRLADAELLAGVVALSASELPGAEDASEVRALEGLGLARTRWPSPRLPPRSRTDSRR